MEIPAALHSGVVQGRAVLFLGAGASKGAKDNRGQESPSTPELRQRLAARFLGRAAKEGETLAWISALAVSESDLGAVQDYIKDEMVGLQPAPFHLLIPKLRWRGIFSTNYDLVIERSYSEADKPVQQVVPFISNHDRVDDKIHSPRHVALVKLHGCITRTHDDKLPLILTTEQYITHRDNRDRLFNLLYEWGHEYPIVFIGYGLEDSDIRAALLELGKLGDFRPRYYLVKPSFEESERRLWEGKRITVIQGTLEEFLSVLDRDIPEAFRLVSTTASVDHPITHRFATTATISEECRDYLAAEAEYVHASIRVTDGHPRAFYKGFDLGWYGIVENLDVRRKLTDEILFDRLLVDEADRSTTIELFLIKAEAGAGKSILLRRLAWETGVAGEQVCLFVGNQGCVRYEPIRELFALIRSRMFLFVDNAADHVAEIVEVIRRARADGLHLTIIVAERMSTWNTSCDRLEPYVSDSFLLKNLSRTEIEQLVDLLEKHKSLGVLERLGRESRVTAFVERAGRQLLVALHEATSGRPFEDTLLDEYNEIRPREAQALYLTVCVLNRLGIPVRAGVIARVHRIPFTQFRERLFGPLEHVVRVTENRATRDYYYTARHPEIAAIVFARVLTLPADRYNEYVSLLGALNLAFSTDMQAYRSLVRARTLIGLFPDHADVVGIFDIAGKVAGDDAYLFQQRGIYEMLRPSGNLREAQRLLVEARSRSPRDTSILHSIAELARVQSERAENPVLRERYRQEARRLAQTLLADEGSREYALHTLVKMDIQVLEELLEGGTATDAEIDATVERVERNLGKGAQEYPNSSYLLASEADFSSLIKDDARALMALRKAFEGNRRNVFIAIRLARVYEDRGEDDKANAILKDALDVQPGDKGLHFRYAMNLKSRGRVDGDTLIYHFRRAFTQWDSNYEAQFWCARYAFESVDEETRKLGREIFRRLRNAPMKHDTRNGIRSYMVDDVGTERSCTGTISRRQETSGFVQVDGRGEWLFFHRNDQSEERWPGLREGSRVVFKIGFAMGGPRGVDLTLT